MKSLSEAQQQAAQSMADVMNVLENRSIAEEDIQTARYDIQPFGNGQTEKIFSSDTE